MFLKKSFKNFLILSSALSFTGSLANATMTLPLAIQQSITTNPEILASRANQEAVTYRIDQARAGYFPTLDFRGGAGYEFTRQKFGANQLNRGVLAGNVSTPRYDPSLSLRQMVFDGFGTPNQVEKAKKEMGQAENKVLETREVVAYNTADAFISVRRFQRLERLAHENIKMHKEIIGKIRELVRAGKETIDAQQTVQARLDDAQAALRDIQGDLNTAIARFAYLTGKEPGRLENAAVEAPALPKSASEALKIAQAHNRSLKVAQSAVEVARSDADISEAPFWPRLDIELDGHRYWNADTKTGSETNFRAMAVVRYNLFNGGKDTGRQQELRAKMTQAKYDMMNQRKIAEREVRISWAQMQSAQQQSEALRKAVKEKNNVRNTYKAQFVTGKQNFIAILDATHEYFLAKGSLITSDAVYDVASVRLLAAMGVLVKRMDKTPKA